MSEAFAVFLFDTLHGAVFVAVAVVGVSLLFLVFISHFKDLFGGSL